MSLLDDRIQALSRVHGIAREIAAVQREHCRFWHDPYRDGAGPFRPLYQIALIMPTRPLNVPVDPMDEHWIAALAHMYRYLHRVIGL